MEDSGAKIRVTVLWKGNKYNLEIDSEANLKTLGYELIKLTGVMTDTLRLIVPRLNQKGSNLVLPFSDEHSSLSLREASIIEGKTIRMMGVSEEEVGGVLADALPDTRILGFEEEERRLRQKKSYVSSNSIKLPQGPYIFGDFRTLQIPGIQLNPPPSHALKRMHMLAADPGIIAMMNKHRWRVGIMTELAPVGYVGVSPKCLLGFNKNQGEEISLRLRTDDLKGFRKYASIKKTLLHELAHMVHTEHDEKFYALDRQLNKEAESLDWTKSASHTLNGSKVMNDYEEDDFFDEDESFSQRLGGNVSDKLGNARETSVAAAYRRLSRTDENSEAGVSKLRLEPDPDDIVDETTLSYPKAQSDSWSKSEPDPEDTSKNGATEMEIPSNSGDALVPEPYLGAVEITKDLTESTEDDDEPDPDDLETHTSISEVENMKISKDTEMSEENLKSSSDAPPRELSSDESMQATADRNTAEVDEPDPDDEEIKRIQDSVTVISNRLKKAINALETEATNVLQMLLKIVRNIISQPNEIKFKRLRKGNPAIKNNILRYAAAVEILSVIGFVEEMMSEGTGAQEPYLVLKRNDPGLLWIAKSIIESHTTISS